MAGMESQKDSFSILDTEKCDVKDSSKISIDESQLDAPEKMILPEKINCGEEKNNKSKIEVFKKPVLLIGPRKGKVVGKMQILRSSDPPDPPSEEKETCSEDKEDSVTSSTNSIVVSNKEEEEENDPIEVKKDYKISPAQKLNENSYALPYKEPKWSGIPADSYKFEVLKNGSIVEMIDLSSKPYFVFGRLTTCDIHMAHPTVSRFHAVLQYRSDNTDGAVGFYVYDLGSTHGTFLNKYRIKPNMYVRIHVGHLLKLGGSSRMFILHGPEEDMEKESELTVTELKEKRKEEQVAKDLKEIQELEDLRLQKEKEEANGIDWGMGDDADEETDLSENPFAAAPNEELYLEDPKKTLRGWFEREGYDLEYDVDEKGFGQFLCRVELPVECAKGGSITAESLVKGKKKEAVVQCALEACRILDRYGLLRQAKHESRKRKVKNWEENDYYDSDEDEFLDRTGTVEKKRQQRMKAAGKLETQTDTYESLVKKHEDILTQIDQIQTQLDGIVKKKERNREVAEDEDALDAFMTNLSSEVPDNKLINKLKADLLGLRKEEVHVRKLVNIACPASLPKLTEQPVTESPLPSSSSSSSSSSQLRSKLSIGHKRKLPRPLENESAKVKVNYSDNETKLEEEEEEEEDEEENNSDAMKNTEKEVIRDSNGEEEGEEERNKKEEISVSKESENEASPKEVIEDKSSFLQEGKSASTQLLNEEKTHEAASGGNDNVEGSNPGKNTKIIGPSLPADFIAEGQTEKRKKRSRQRYSKKNMKESDINHSSDPNYSMWVPPENQSGDGKTKLNEKYGY